MFFCRTHKANFINEQGYSINEEIIVQNYWNDNKLSLVRNIFDGEEGRAVFVPTDLMVKDNRLFIFNYEGKNIVELNMDGQLQDIYSVEAYSGIGFKKDSLYARFNRGIKEIDLNRKVSTEINTIRNLGLISFDEKKDLFYAIDGTFETITISKQDQIKKVINLEDIFARNNMDSLGGYQHFIKNNNLYCHTEFNVVDSEETTTKEEYYSGGIIVLDINQEKLEKITAKNKAFGYYILGIDQKNRIYTTTNYYVERILVHNEKGELLLQIKQDLSKYGKPIPVFTDGLVHPVYITENGQIYVMIQTEEGTFIVRYTHSA